MWIVSVFPGCFKDFPRFYTIPQAPTCITVQVAFAWLKCSMCRWRSAGAGVEFSLGPGFVALICSRSWPGRIYVLDSAAQMSFYLSQLGGLWPGIWTTREERLWKRLKNAGPTLRGQLTAVGKLPCEAAREAVVTHTHLGGECSEAGTSFKVHVEVSHMVCRWPFSCCVLREHHPWVLVSVVAPFLKIMLSFILNQGSLC